MCVCMFMCMCVSVCMVLGFDISSSHWASSPSPINWLIVFWVKLLKSQRCQDWAQIGHLPGSTSWSAGSTGAQQSTDTLLGNFAVFVKRQHKGCEMISYGKLDDLHFISSVYSLREWCVETVGKSFVIQCESTVNIYTTIQWRIH